MSMTRAQLEAGTAYALDTMLHDAGAPKASAREVSAICDEIEAVIGPCTMDKNATPTQAEMTTAVSIIQGRAPHLPTYRAIRAFDLARAAL